VLFAQRRTLRGMTAKRVIPTLAATAAAALGTVPAASASTDVQTASSANWAGYVVGGSSSATRYKSVSGSWVVPTVKCTSGQSYSSFWVGLGGSGSGSSSTSASDSGSWSDPSSMSGSASGSSSSTSLEQAGTEADCGADGSATYSAWYELVPSPPVKVGLSVHPGDHVTSKVTVDGSNVTVQLSNTTTGQSFEKTLQASSPDVSSAEWIAEAPSTCTQGASNCTPLSLADFGTAQFSGASATTTDGHTGTVSDSNWQTAAVTLSPSASQSGFGDAQFTSYDSSSAGATPSSLSSDGSSFSVAWSSDGSGSSSAGSGTGLGSDVSGSGSSGYPGDGYGGWGGYDYPGGYGDSYGGYGYAYVPGFYLYSY
jgi:Peptidase A4 family